jgi:hypothetical protein
MNTYNLDNPAYLEAKGLAKVWKAYADYCNGEDIMEVGFNANSGYVYIALEYGISIGSAFGQAVEFIVTDLETGEEFFEETLFDAEARLEEINTRNYA